MSCPSTNSDSAIGNPSVPLDINGDDNKERHHQTGVRNLLLKRGKDGHGIQSTPASSSNVPGSSVNQKTIINPYIRRKEHCSIENSANSSCRQNRNAPIASLPAARPVNPQVCNVQKEKYHEIYNDSTTGQLNLPEFQKSSCIRRSVVREKIIENDNVYDGGNAETETAQQSLLSSSSSCLPAVTLPAQVWNPYHRQRDEKKSLDSSHSKPIHQGMKHSQHVCNLAMENECNYQTVKSVNTKSVIQPNNSDYDIDGKDDMGPSHPCSDVPSVVRKHSSSGTISNPYLSGNLKQQMKIPTSKNGSLQSENPSSFEPHRFHPPTISTEAPFTSNNGNEETATFVPHRHVTEERISEQNSSSSPFKKGPTKSTKIDYRRVCSKALVDENMDQISCIETEIPSINIDRAEAQKLNLNSSTQKSFYSTCSSKPKLPPQLEYEDSRIRPINDEYRLKLIKAADLGGTLKNGWKLLPHQKVGILKAVQMRRLILAYDMGLGKTLIGCVFAKAFKQTFPNLKVYVISPVTLKKEWERTATDIVGLECEVERKGAGEKMDQESLALRVTSWAKVPLRVPTNVERFVVICDEAHNLQSMESARTKDTLKLVLGERCIGCLLLTGTPMKNGRPSNLFPLLRAVRHPFGDDQKRYEFFFCNGHMKTFGNREVWDASGSSNLSLLNAHVVSHVLYKTKDDCLKELPEKVREYKNVPVGSKYEIQHNRALNELAVIYNSYSISVNDEATDAILGAFSRLRQIAAFAKIDATVALAEEILQKESSVVIFTCFVSAAKELHKKLESAGWIGEVLAGETPSAKRQKMVDNFQQGVKPVFIGTFGAAGVGITLTAARTIILMDRPWTPGDALQAEDRVRRIGQTKTVRSIWMRSFNIDEQIDSLIEQKSQNANSIVERNPKRNESRAAPKISIRKLVESIVTKSDVK